MTSRPFLHGSIVGFALIATAASSASAQATHAFDLRAQPLAQALTAVGGAVHATVAFPPSLVAGKPAPRLRGDFTTPAALAVLLAGSGLRAMITGGGSYIVEPLPAPDAFGPTSVRTGDAAPQTVVVRGYRASLTQSLLVRRTYSGELESVVAEDIAKFPDSNVAEAIGRVAGVSISRDQGEGRSVTVRGLGPEFIGTEINGISAQAATGGPYQGVNRGRGFDFNVFPSELFSRIDVRKTSEADQTEGGLGATIALYTLHPFDKRGLRLALSAQTTVNDQSRKAGEKGAFFFSNTFDQSRMGVLLSIAYSRTPIDIEGVNSGGWSQGTTNGGFCRPTTGTGGLCDVPATALGAALASYDLAGQASTFVPQFYRYTELTGTAQRFGADASFQWRPSDQTILNVDAIYSTFSTDRTDHYLEAISFSRGASQGGRPEMVPLNVGVNAEGAMTYGVFDNVDVRSELHIDDFKTDFSQFSVQLKHKFSDKLFAEVIGGGSRSSYENFENLTLQIDRFNVDGYAFDTRTTGLDRPAITYGFDVTNPANWYFGPRVTADGGTGATGPEIRLRPDYVYDDLYTFQARITYDPSARYRLSAGIQAKRYTNRDVSYRFDQGEADFPVPSVPLGQLTDTFCGLATAAPPIGTPRCWAEPDASAFIKAYDLFSNTGKTALSTSNVAARGLNQAVTEDDLAVYGKVWFKRSLFGLPLRGDVGLRAVQTRQFVAYVANTPTDPDPAGFSLSSVTRTYSDLLPSLNFVLETSKQSLWRLSAAQVMSRPPLEDLDAATTVTVDGGRRAVTTGNPNLAPFRATTVDLSYEWYHTPGGIASVGLFYKNISTFVQTVTHIAPYASTGLPDALLANTGAAPSDDFSISKAVNTRGGPLDGLELNFQTPLRFLPGRWSKVGFLVNYTYVISRITYQTTSVAGPATLRSDLTDLSRNAYNATIYYDDGVFQARLSNSFRDKYIIAVPGAFNMDATGMKAARFWDCSASYKITPRLAATFEGQNLTNEKSESWDGTASELVEDVRRSGRQFALGLRYAF